MDAVEVGLILITAFQLYLIFDIHRRLQKLNRFFEKHQHSKKMRDVVVID